MSVKVNGKKFPSPTCPKCGNPTFLRGSVKILSNESKYLFYCPDCEIYAPQANTAEKAAKNFEEVAKQYKQQEAKNMLELYNGGKGGAIGIGKLAAGTDLKEINAAGIYSVDTSNTPDCTAIYYKDPETIIKVIEYMRAQGYIVEATAKGIIIQGKAAGG